MGPISSDSFGPAALGRGGSIMDEDLSCELVLLRGKPAFEGATCNVSIAALRLSRPAMPANLRPLSTGQLLDSTFQVYRQNFMLFAGISAVPHVCLLVFQLGFLFLMGQGLANPAASVAIGAVFGIAVLLISIVVSAIATAATTFGVSDVYLEKPTS